MSFLYRKLHDALFAPPEAYRQKYVVPRVEALRQLPAPGQGEGQAPAQLENRLFISGGKLDTRLRVLRGAIAQQLKAGRAVVVVQPAGKPLYSFTTEFTQRYLNACDGSYDPLCGYSVRGSSLLLSHAASALGLSASEASALLTPLCDEMEYFAQHRGELGMGSFVNATSRELGAAAFEQGDARLAESHSAGEVSNRLDWLRASLEESCRFGGAGTSLRTAARAEAVTVVRLPQDAAGWLAIALAELKSLSNSGGLDVLPVFLDFHISDTCRPFVEGLPCGRCFCYQDLPALGWVWSAAIAASSTGCLLRHTGESAQIASRYFGKTKASKRVSTASSAISKCDSGGLMGIFDSTTLSDSHGCSVSYEWEPAIPEGVISALDDDEGIFIFQNHNKPYRINL